MLCSNCRTSTAVTADGRCDTCALAEQAQDGIGGLIAPPMTAPKQARTGPGELASPARLATAATVLLVLCIAADVFSLVAAGRYRRVLDGLILERWATSTSLVTDVAAVERAYNLSGSIQVTALLATAVVFIVWFRRTRINAEVFDPAGHRRGRGWAIGAWFTPVVNLWFPRQIAGDIWEASSPPGRRASLALVNAWWGLWIAALAIGRAGSTQVRQAEELDEIRTAVQTLFVSDLLDVAAALLAIVFVRRLTAMQTARITDVGPAPASGPVPDALPSSSG